MRQVTVATLKLFGGHAALDFTNTVDSRGARYGPDVLMALSDLVDWAVRLEVIDAAEAAVMRDLPDEQAKAALHRAKALRETIYRIFAAPSTSSPEVEPDDLNLLQREACSAQAQRMLVLDGSGYAWRWRADDPQAITHRIACAAADLLTSPLRRRVHVCPGENCGWLFLDNSRPGRRLWCSEETCGTRNRVQRWRDRKRKPGADASGGT